MLSIYSQSPYFFTKQFILATLAVGCLGFLSLNWYFKLKEGRERAGKDGEKKMYSDRNSLPGRGKGSAGLQVFLCCSLGFRRGLSLSPPKNHLQDLQVCKKRSQIDPKKVCFFFPLFHLFWCQNEFSFLTLYSEQLQKHQQCHIGKTSVCHMPNDVSVKVTGLLRNQARF